MSVIDLYLELTPTQFRKLKKLLDGASVSDPDLALVYRRFDDIDRHLKDLRKARKKD